MTSWNPGGPPDPSGQQPQYGQQPPPPPQYGQQPPPPPQYGQQPPPPPPQYGQQPPQYGQQPPQYGQQQYPQPPQYGQVPQYPGGPNPYGVAPSGPGQPADVGKRFLAYILDVVMIGVPLAIIWIILVAAFVSSAHCSTDANGQNFNCTGASGGGVLVVVWLLVVLAVFLYPIIFIGNKGATYGMRIVGTKVVDISTGGPIGIGRAFIRQLLFGICFIVALSSLFDSSPQHRGWHDQAANDIVISTK